VTGLITDTTIVVSIMASAATGVLVVALRRLARPPAWWLLIPPVVVTVLVAVTDLARYGRSPRRGIDPLTGALVAASLAAALAVAAAPTPGPHRRGDGRWDLDPVAVTLTAAVVGLFLCIPETDLLRALLVPVAVAAGASSTGLVKPFGPIEIVTLSCALAWVAVADGQSRPPSMVGAAAGIAAVGLRALGPPHPPPARPVAGRVTTILVSAAAVTAARVAGLRPTVTQAVLVALTFLIPTAIMAVGLRMTAIRSEPRLTREERTMIDGASRRSSEGPARTRLGGTAKRSLDVAAALIGLIATGPVLAAVAVLIRLSDGAPVLFRQERSGRDGEPFVLYKFRTMSTESEDPTTDAARITRLGAFLRATSLDELPTLWNVAVGDMSLVGPRPLPVRYLERYSPEQRRRLQVRPGITGLAQVGGRNTLSWEERFALDVTYVDERSFIGDLWILLRTLRSVVAREGVEAAANVTMAEFTGTTGSRSGGEPS
jgi:lipopolysaccharide/colanic/teichoic acid biosynthesis glycosyltransferase